MNEIQKLNYKSDKLRDLLQSFGIISYRLEHYKEEWAEDFQEIFEDFVSRIETLKKEIEELEKSIIDNKNKPTKNIPKGGDYCYDKNGICPYFHIDPLELDQNNGVCLFLGERDSTYEGIPLLWDQIKSCDF